MIIILNGASSSGKTTLARALQHLTPDFKFLTLGQDSFIKMMPYGMLGFSQFAREGFFFEYLSDGKNIDPRIAIRTGDFGKKLIEGAAKTAAMLADIGFNLIIDEVLLEPLYLDLYIRSLSDKKVYFIKVFCELKVLQEREILRDNRSWGIACEQFHTIHPSYYHYDFEVDTTISPTFDNAKSILAFIAKCENPSGLNATKEALVKKY